MLVSIKDTQKRDVLFNPWQVESIYTFTPKEGGRSSTKIQLSKGSFIHTYDSVLSIQEAINDADR